MGKWKGSEKNEGRKETRRKPRRKKRLKKRKKSVVTKDLDLGTVNDLVQRIPRICVEKIEARRDETRGETGPGTEEGRGRETAGETDQETEGIETARAETDRWAWGG